MKSRIEQGRLTEAQRLVLRGEREPRRSTLEALVRRGLMTPDGSRTPEGDARAAEPEILGLGLAAGHPVAAKILGVKGGAASTSAKAAAARINGATGGRPRRG